MVEGKQLNEAQLEALERVKASMLEDGTIMLEAKNNWFVHVDPKDPNKTEIFTTQVAGDPESARKIHSAIIHPGPPWPQLIFVENDIKEDGTVGRINPLVCVSEDGSFVAVEHKVRHNGVVVEAFRGSWSKPEAAPKLIANGGVVVNYTDHDLGRGLSNDARVIAPDGKVAQIAYDLTVVKGVKGFPYLDKGSWMPVEEFLVTTIENMGKAVVAMGAITGKFPIDKDKLEEQILRLPSLVESNFGYKK